MKFELYCIERLNDGMINLKFALYSNCSDYSNTIRFHLSKKKAAKFELYDKYTLSEIEKIIEEKEE